MDGPPGSKKKWELTPAAFAKLVAELAEDPEIAAGKYEELRRQLIKFFEWRGALFADQLADETLNRLTRKIDEGEAIEKNIVALALGIARFVFLETLKAPDLKRANVDEMIPLASEEHGEEDDLWLSCLREC